MFRDLRLLTLSGLWVLSLPILHQGWGATLEEGSVRNSFGVQTEELSPIRIFVAPRIGYHSTFGLADVEISPEVSIGGEFGVLLSGQIFLGVFYSSSSQNMFISGLRPGSEFQWTLKTAGVGTRFFLLSQASWAHPYFGGGLSWSQGRFGPLAPEFQTGHIVDSDIQFSQFGGFGEVGVELNLTRSVVGTFQFKLAGVISSSTGEGDVQDQEIRDRGNSVSRSASYLLGVGVGIYF